ncbi:hypothetical protein HJG60_010308 [Phyllostomus discolor]|uniref:Uncharacterized protein n=1 Tax=Phyllostomus discolor TaxID=89673 RepID=A0A834B1K7_9CHIR|nr:hypothetical protein HJG60_010308 [Phyllostomus discolor]
MTKEASIYNVIKTISAINAVWKIGQITCKRMKLDNFLTLYARIKPKCIKDLNVGLKTKKFLEENISGKLFDITLSNIFWICLLGQGKQKKNNKQMGLYQIKSFCSPDWCGPVCWAPSCRAKGHQFGSQSRHMPGLWASPLLGHMQEGTDPYFSHASMLLSLSFSLLSSLFKNK